MCPKGGQMCQMESVRLSINEHMTSVVGEDILCVLEKQSDACCAKLVRALVLERLSAAAEWMCNLFQREIESLETLLDHQSKLLDMAFNVDPQLHTAEGHEGRSSSLQQEAGSQEQEVLHGRPERTDVSTSILLQKKTPCGFQELPVCKQESEHLDRLSSEHLERLSSEHLERLSSEHLERLSSEHLDRLSSEHLDRLSSEHLERLSSEHLERLSALPQEEDEDAVPPQFQRGAPAPTPGAEASLLPSVKSEEEEEDEECDGEDGESGRPAAWKEAQEEKPFSCMFCRKSFNLNGNLKRHMRIHTGERPFGCPTCAKRFGEKKDLHRHMRTHTGEKPFSCALCSKRFSESSSLKTHMTIHTGEKRFVCTVCGKGWCKRDDLTKHMRIHTGEKPFACTVCGRRFSRGETLKKHIRTHRGKAL